MTAAAVAAAPPAAIPAHSAWHSPDGFGFRDLLDIVNPLQHIPIISSIYRWITGDRPGEAAQIAGDALYGGPIGVAVGLVSAATEDKAGHDLGEQALVAMFGNHDHGTVVAAAAATSPASAMANPATASATPAFTGPAATRAPIPLFGGIAVAPGTSSSSGRPPLPLARHAVAAGAQPQSATLQFLAHQAALERHITSGGNPSTQTAPVPLVIPAGTLPQGARTTAIPAAPNFGVPVTAPNVPNPASDTPIDISQKMLDALDKYMKLEKDREKSTAPAPAPSVDMSL